MLQEWKKDKRTFSSLLVKPRKQLLPHLSLNHWLREVMKSFTWLTPSMNTLFNNSRNTMERNSKTAPKKVWNSNKLKMKRSPSKKRRLLLNLSANKSRKFLVIKLKRLLLDNVLMNHHAFLLLVNTVGQQTWKESWKLKLSEMLPCQPTWSPRRPWKSMLTTQLSKNLKPDLTRIKLTRLLKILSGSFTTLPSLPQVSHLMNLHHLLTVSTEWLSLDFN